MSAMSGPSRARWYNPTNGTYIDISAGTYNLPNAGNRVFLPPGDNGTGYTDWVLLLRRLPTTAERANASLSELGQAL